MAFKKPVINTIKTHIKDVSIYLRTTKKFGKSTLFRDVIIEKYGDPSYGLLVPCGKERGVKMLDNLNTLPDPIQTFKEFKELKDWLIQTKGVEHNIEIIAFDTVDELVPIFEKETIRLSKIDNPEKPCRSINAAFGGFQAGQRYTANELIKPYMDELANAGFGIWAISHTKFKTIKEKGGTDENGYQQLTSNLEASYESAFGDIFDVCLTGTIDRPTEGREVKQGDKVVSKNYITGDTVRKLYFRETPLVDAGGRFSMGAVPDYMIFDKGNMAKDFINVIETGLEKSKTTNKEISVDIDKAIEPMSEKVIVEKLVDVNVVSEIDSDDEEPIMDVDIEALKKQIQQQYKNADKATKKKLVALKGDNAFADINDVDLLNEMLALFE